MRIHKSGEFKGKKKSDKSTDRVIVDHAASPKKLKIAGIANKIIPGGKGIRIKPIKRKPNVEETKKIITGRSKADEKSSEGNNEDHPRRKNPGRINS